MVPPGLGMFSMVLEGSAALVGLVGVSAVVGGVLGVSACFCGEWALRGGSISFFQEFFASAGKTFILGGKTGHWSIIL